MSDEAVEGLTFILPVCNQAAALEPSLTAWTRTLAKLKRPFEILVVDDGSTDETCGILDRLTGGPDDPCGILDRVTGGLDSPAQSRQLRVLRHERRRGFGASLRTAITEAKYPLLFYTGLDYDYSPGELNKFLERADVVDPELNRRPDLVNGFRSRVQLPTALRLIGWLWRSFMRVVVGYPAEPTSGWLGWSAWRYRLRLRLLFGIRVQDVDSKYKLLRRAVFDRFPIQSDGDFVHAEIIAKINFLGSLMDELPIAKKPGPYPAVPEHPSAAASVSPELQKVFREPLFLPPAVSPSSVPGAPVPPAAKPP